MSLLDLREISLLYRQSWPHLLVITAHNRLSTWAHLLAESSLKRTTRPLAGGLTTLEAMDDGLYSNIWQDLANLALATDLAQIPHITFSQLLREPASEELAEAFSQQRHFYQLRLKEAALPPPRTKERLTRYVGDSLQDEATHLNREQI
ncbi:hypothetical protein [Ktedonobacter robiniae]|uniref:Uncharacterized protein n=1 Tax=Ktedonobacter robiniae TaxID=2778365 RepID=A0ABQ3V0N7_9CHLR|nr:hypothetical protein [Ktedonobacter robiniae]GHO58473.1 hypothetical protein KSB_69480 [Ktedonobacter robiniae]